MLSQFCHMFLRLGSFRETRVLDMRWQQRWIPATQVNVDAFYG